MPLPGAKEGHKDKKEEGGGQAPKAKGAGGKEGKGDKPAAKRHKAQSDADFVEVEPGAGCRVSAVAVKQVGRVMLYSHTQYTHSHIYSHTQ